MPKMSELDPHLESFVDGLGYLIIARVNTTDVEVSGNFFFLMRIFLGSKRFRLGISSELSSLRLGTSIGRIWM